MVPAAEHPRSRFERRYYGIAALLVAVLAFAGFAPTYYLKSAFGAPALPGLVHLHGAVMTLWIVLFVTQARLVAAHRVDLHRRLGVAGGVLAALIVVVGIATAIDSARRGVSPGPPPLVFLAIPLAVVLEFGILVGAALAMRRRSDWHKRLMLTASVAILTPAIARLPGIHEYGIVLFFALTDVILVACIAWDTVTHRRLHPAFRWGGAFVLLAQPAQLALAGSALWMGIAQRLVA